MYSLRIPLPATNERGMDVIIGATLCHAMYLGYYREFRLGILRRDTVVCQRGKCRYSATNFLLKCLRTISAALALVPWP